MMSWLRRNPMWAVPSGLALAGTGAWLIFGYFGFQTLFFDDEVNEDVPVFASGAGASGFESDATTEEEAKEVNDLMVEEGTPLEDPAEESMPEEMPEAEIQVQYQGSFIDRSHPSEGIAEVLNATLLKLAS